jgi:hypothetical protein
MQAPKVFEPTVTETELDAGTCISLAVATAEPTPSVQLTVVVPVFENTTTAPAGSATLPEVPAAVSVAKFPFGVNPVTDADTVALTHCFPVWSTVRGPLALPSAGAGPLSVPHDATT